MLLVLDNVEQVVDAAPELSALLAGSSASLLATSRILLRIRGEQNIPLGPLRPEAGSELFVERARAVKPDFEVTAENAGAVAAICAALDNAPLALELAAARLRVLTPAALVERLDHALPVLVGGARDLPARQRTLRATIDWSAQLLTETERELLLRLGVFRAGFALDAVEWMSEGLHGTDAVESLGALVDGSLVREQDRGSQAWFTMLATVREYGARPARGAGTAGGGAGSGTRASSSGSPPPPTPPRPGADRSSASRASSTSTTSCGPRSTTSSRRAGSTPSPSWRGRSTRSGGVAAEPATSGPG